VRIIAKRIQEAEQKKRKSEEPLNSYAVGDYVLFDEASRGFRNQKLKPRYSGPYMVVSIHKADVTCKHIVTAKQKVYHMENLKPFIGSLDEAYKAAQADDDQYVILSIIDYRGEPRTRSFMEFLVRFEGDEDVWLQYSADLASATPFQDYILLHPELEPLTMSTAEWRLKSAEYNRRGITGVAPGDICLVNLKSWGNEYFQSLLLPTGPVYVVECRYLKWTSPQRKKIDLCCPLFGQLFDWDATATRLYGMNSVLLSNMVSVDEVFCRQYPQITE
jgi:hypothetical protein